MSQHPTRRIVVDVDAADHMALKSVAASAGTSIKSVVLSALRNELQARQRALVRPAPRATK